MEIDDAVVGLCLAHTNLGYSIFGFFYIWIAFLEFTKFLFIDIRKLL